MVLIIFDIRQPFEDTSTIGLRRASCHKLIKHRHIHQVEKNPPRVVKGIRGLTHEESRQALKNDSAVLDL